MMRAVVLGPLALALVACGDRGEDAPAPAASAVPPQIPQADERVKAARIVVNADGFSNGGSGTRTFVRFGAPRVQVDALAEAALQLPVERSSNPDCGAGPMDFTQIGPLQLAYQDGNFVGWFLRGGAGVVTVDGVSVGQALAQVQEWRPVRVITDSTLDGEFEYLTRDGGMITGFFDGSQNDGAIIALSAGLNCFFR